MYIGDLCLFRPSPFARPPPQMYDLAPPAGRKRVWSYEICGMPRLRLSRLRLSRLRLSRLSSFRLSRLRLSRLRLSRLRRLSRVSRVMLRLSRLSRLRLSRLRLRFNLWHAPRFGVEAFQAERRRSTRESQHWAGPRKKYMSDLICGLCL